MAKRRARTFYKFACNYSCSSPTSRTHCAVPTSHKVMTLCTDLFSRTKKKKQNKTLRFTPCQISEDEGTHNLTCREASVPVRLTFPYKTLFKIGFNGNNHPLKLTAHILLMEDQLQLKPLNDPKMSYNPSSWTSFLHQHCGHLCSNVQCYCNLVQKPPTQESDP